MHTTRRLSPISALLLSFMRKTHFDYPFLRAMAMRILQRDASKSFVADINHVPMIFYPDDIDECAILFDVHAVTALQFIRKYTQHKGAVMIDIGARSGAYAQHFLAGGTERTIIAVESRDIMRDRIRNNFELLQHHHYEPSRKLHLLSHIEQISPVTDILEQNHITQIDLLKIDARHYQSDTLLPFIDHGMLSLMPAHIMIEYPSHYAEPFFTFLKSRKYRQIGSTCKHALFSMDILEYHYPSKIDMSKFP